MSKQLAVILIVCLSTVCGFAQRENDSIKITPLERQYLDYIQRYDSLSRQQSSAQKNMNKMVDFQQRVTNYMYGDNPNDDKFRAKLILPVGSRPEYGISVGAGVDLSFKTKKEMNLHRSSVPVYAAFSVKSPFSYEIRATPDIYLHHNLIRVGGDFHYIQWQDNFYGVGYSEVRDRVKEKGVTTYMYRRMRLDPKVMLCIFNQWWYVGALGSVIKQYVYRPGTFVQGYDQYQQQGFNEDGGSYTIGGGINVVFDTREADYWRMLFDVKMLYYGGSGYSYGKLQVDYRQYENIAGYKNSTLAWGICSSNVFGKNIPMFEYASIGDIYSFRGYLGNQYRDNSAIKASIEYRYHFNFDSYWGRLIVNRLGFSVFAGIGAIGPKILKYECALPNFGAGVRFQLTEKRAFRFECAYNTVNRKCTLYWGISEAF